MKNKGEEIISEKSVISNEDFYTQLYSNTSKSERIMKTGGKPGLEGTSVEILSNIYLSEGQVPQMCPHLFKRNSFQQ